MNRTVLEWSLACCLVVASSLVVATEVAATESAVQSGVPSSEEKPRSGGLDASRPDAAGASVARGNPSSKAEGGAEGEPRYLDPLADEGYRTPRAGEAFRTEVFGQPVDVEARDRRSVSAWSLGFEAVAPGATFNEFLPFGALYYWRRPDENTFLRSVVAVFFNEIEYAESTDSMGPFEFVFTLENLNIPSEDAEYIDGDRQRREEVVWGRVHPGMGIGYRQQLEPGYNDNLFAVSLLAEPGFLYFWHDGSSATAEDFVDPEDTVEMRGRLRVRLDKMERNLLELAHSGYMVGGDLFAASRLEWDDWGRNEQESAGPTKEWVAFSGYAAGATGVPFVRSQRHRLLGTLHGGTGTSQDRWSKFRVGGGPQDFEYGAIVRPTLPGAFFDEFLVDNYALLTAEYRYEPIFFTYLGLRSSLTYLERRRIGSDRIREEDDFLFSLGGRVHSGFLFETRLHLAYNYNFDVIRDENFGGHEVTLEVSGAF